MQRKIWAIVKPGAEKKPLITFREHETEKLAFKLLEDETGRLFIEGMAPGPYKIVLLAVKAWRKFRKRQHQKAVMRVCKAPFGEWRDDPHERKSRITRGAVVVLKEITVGKAAVK